MIEMFDEWVGEIPVTHAVPHGCRDAVLPSVIVLHSFGVSKELVTYFGVLGARAGLRILMPGAPEHGPREIDIATRPARFWDILRSYVDEVDEIRMRYLPLMTQGKVAIAGTSMGAFAALSATVRYDWICATAAYMGTAYFSDAARSIYPPLGLYSLSCAEEHEHSLRGMAAYDPSQHLARLEGRALYVWHGARDDIVPHADALRLAHDLFKRDAAQRLIVDIDAAGSHRVTDRAAQAGVQFLKDTLRG